MKNHFIVATAFSFEISCHEDFKYFFVNSASIVGSTNSCCTLLALVVRDTDIAIVLVQLV